MKNKKYIIGVFVALFSSTITYSMHRLITVARSTGADRIKTMVMQKRAMRTTNIVKDEASESVERLRNSWINNLKEQISDHNESSRRQKNFSFFHIINASICSWILLNFEEKNSSVSDLTQKWNVQCLIIGNVGLMLAAGLDFAYHWKSARAKEKILAQLLSRSIIRR